MKRNAKSTAVVTTKYLTMMKSINRSNKISPKKRIECAKQLARISARPDVSAKYEKR